MGFMSPEQLINCRYVKPAADIYSVGACLYFLLSGKLPYDAVDARSEIAMILNSPPKELVKHAFDLPPRLIELVERAMAREPTDRYASAGAMREALLRFTEK